MKMELQIDAEFQSLIPPLGAEELNQLEANITKDGCRDPLVVWNGTLIDGHNRYEICTRLAIAFETVAMEFESRAHVRLWMRANQKGRRNLSTAWLIELELGNKADLIEIGGKKKIEEGKKTGRGNKKVLSDNDNTFTAPKHNTRNEIAKAANVSTGMVGMAEQIKKKAPEVWEKAKSGEVSISTAYQDIKKQEKKDAKEQRKIATVSSDDDGQLEKFTVKLGDVIQLGRHRLICGDSSKLKIEADAVITDPPYGIDYLPDWSKWDGTPSQFKKISGDTTPFDPSIFLQYRTMLFFGANYYSSMLPVGGWLVWDKRLDEVKDAMLGSPFELAWFVSKHTSRKSIMIRVLHGGVVNADSEKGNNAKRYHPTQKPIVLFEKILEQITSAGETVYDPFAGSGTTLLACERSSRNCIAAEIDPAYCGVVIGRWKNLTGMEPKWLESSE